MLRCIRMSRKGGDIVNTSEANQPKVFISYSWDDKDWVKSLADSLLADGIDVILDEYDMVPGDRYTKFMEQNITKADYVLIVCSPQYKKKADSCDRVANEGKGVKYETNIISSELFEHHNERKFIPVLRRGSFSAAWPIYLRGKKGIDLSNKKKFEKEYKKLVDTLLGKFTSSKPPVGSSHTPNPVSPPKNWTTIIRSILHNAKKHKAVFVLVVVGLVAFAVGLYLLLERETNVNGKDWTEWSDDIPSNVTNEDYEIEERTLYSSCEVCEKTTSTESDKMDGWELYDSATGNGDFGPWSNWSQTKVSKSETRDVEAQTRYRYKDKEFTTSDSSAIPGDWTLESTSMTWKEYGSWSEWSQTVVYESDSRQVQKQTQYRYRDKETTTDTSSSLSGWTQYDKTTSGGDWGAWSAWSETPVNNSESIQVEQKTQYSYREKNYKTSSESSLSGWTRYDYSINYGPWSDWSESPVNGSDSIDVERDEVERESANGDIDVVLLYRFRSKSITYMYYSWGPWSDYTDNVVSGNGDREVRTRTLYRYRTRTQATTIYYFYRWKNWSSWSTDAVYQSSTRQIQTRILYRFRDREGVLTYHFFRWKEWSIWSDTKVVETDTRKVESSIFYRYRDRVFETTYYFRKWTNWTEYSEEKVVESEDVQVRTITQYRYRRKEN